MSYSRWGSSYWYTFWCASLKEETENRDNARFEICGVISFTAKELRSDMDACLEKVSREHPDGDIKELQGYMEEFLSDVDEEYPENQ